MQPDFNKIIKLVNLNKEPFSPSGLATMLAALCCFSGVSVALLFLNEQGSQRAPGLRLGIHA